MQDAGPDLTDYVASIRDRLGLVAATCAAGLALGVAAWALTSDSGTTTATASLTVVDIQPPIDAAFGVIEPTAANASELRIAPLVIEINLDQFEDQIAATVDPEHPDDVKVQATATEVADRIALKVEARDRPTAIAGVEATEARVREFRTNVLLARYATVRSGITDARDELVALASSIDAALATAPAGSPERSQLEAEKTSVRRELLAAQRAALALETLDDDSSAGIFRSGDVFAKATRGGLALPIALAIGLLFGLLAGLGLVVLARFLSRDVVSRSDVDHAGVRALAAVGDPETDPVLPTVLARTLGSAGAVVVGTPGAEDDVVAVGRVGSSTSGGSGQLRAVASLGEVTAGDKVVVVVRYGTHEDELRSLARALADVGAEPVGAVLAGIPPRHLVRARSR